MPELNENELQNIKALEDELIAAQQLEIRIKSTDGRNPIQAIVNTYAVKSSLYSDPAKLKAMVIDLRAALKRYVNTANITGRILGKKAVEKFLLESEKRDIAQKQLRLINQANKRQAERRLSTVYMELEKEAGILKADIALFKANARIANFTAKEQLAQLVIAGKEKEGLAQGFAKRMKRVAVDASRREKEASRIAEFSKTAKPNEQWVWIAVSTRPCPDCGERAGKILTLERWERMGFPGSGRTICGRSCRCTLRPVSIADKEFPTVREFHFDKDKLVLTTASELRVLEAKKNQYDLLKKGK